MQSLARVGNEAFPMVCISADDTVIAVIGSLEDKDILCLSQDGTQVIIAIEVGSYHSSWVNHYLRPSLCVRAVVFYSTLSQMGDLDCLKNHCQRY